MKIHKTEEIDHEKLNALFKRRGRKITIPLFTKRVVDILETSDREFEVHQCRCGEVTIFRTEYADYLRQKLNTEDIPCNSCLGLDYLKISGQIFVKLSNILQLMERRKIDRDQNRVYFIEDDFEQLKKEAKGLFATQTFDEFYYSFHNFTNTFFDEFQGKESHASYPLISEIIESALKINPNIVKEFGDDVNAAIELDAATLNIYLVRKSRIDLLSKISDEKFLNSEISEFHEIRTSYSKSGIKSKMTEYKDSVEIKNHLNILLNLINVIEGGRLVPNPFDKLKLPPMNPGGKKRKISDQVWERRVRRDRMKILKSLLVGAGSILVFVAVIFSLGFIGYTIPFCADIGAYLLPFVIPVSLGLTVGAIWKGERGTTFLASLFCRRRGTDYT